MDALRKQLRCRLALNFLFLAVLFSGCATTFTAPAPFNDVALRERAVSVTKDGIHVSAAVPSVEESRAIFGVDLVKKKIQPLWLEIENTTDHRFWFLPTGLDSEYFSPLEVAFGFHKKFSSKANLAIDEHLEALNFSQRIDPGSKVSGFVYTNVDEGLKVVNVDLLGNRRAKNVALLVPTPGQEMANEKFQQLLKRIARLQATEVEDESRLRMLLEQLPCCTSKKDGEQGEPLNFVLIGGPDELFPAFVRRNYRYTEVSSQYVFGRPQDLSARKRDRWVPAQPHVVRFWLTTIRFRGKPVWVGHVSTPLGGRFVRGASSQTSVPIDPDVDAARNDLIQDMAYSQFLTKLGFVKGVGRVMASEPRATPSGVTYHTDGIRAVFLFEQRLVALSEIEFFDWERLIDHHRQQFGEQ
jgi:hypothetical protein